MVQNQLLLSRARSATLARDFDLAARLYRQLLRKDRNNVELLKQLGNLYMKSGRDDLALPVFKNIVGLSKDDFDSLITLGGIYRRLKMYEDSIAILEQALIFDSGNPQVSYNLGFTYKIMGDTENAIECFEDTIEMNPEDVLAYNHLGTIYAQKNEHEKAVHWYLRGLNVDSNHPVLLLNIAKSYEELGDYKKACEAYSKALRSKPLWNDAVGGFSRLLVKINRAPEAHELVKRALSVNPNDESLEENLKYVEKFVEKNKDDENSVENKIQPENQESASEELNLNGEKSDFEEENSDEENAGIQTEIESEQTEENLTEKPEALGGQTLGEALLMPTKIYVKPILALLAAVNVKGISHITGGGFYENIPRSIPDGLCARIEKSRVRVLPIFELLAAKGNIPERDMYNTFNMGVGMTVIVAPEDREKALSVLADAGEEAYEIGTIVRGEDGVTLW